MTQTTDNGAMIFDEPMLVSREEREAMIAVAAYYLAETRAFAPGGEEDDWLRASDAIDRMLGHIRAAGVTRRCYHRMGLRNALRLWTG